MIFCISALCGSALRDALRKTMRSNKTLATTTSATMDNKNKKLKTHLAANSCVHQPYETMYVVSWRLNRNCLNGRFKATICPLPTRKWQINTSKKNTVCRRFEQYNGQELLSATQFHRTILFSTNNGVLFLLPFTPRDKWPQLRERLLFVPISA